ncbi:hypothetical protein DY000_02017896 [Brassica cretica]|uniref:Uncharacterized protein n=1 Tax=Brassica cretica TaxID=69181 RepID=A0ABQ7DCR2_BRACR|nr:hypothetical protein DY000_02017896 [Brassica cretica]
MESTELQDIDYFSSFSDHTSPTFFTPTTSSLRSDSVSEDPDSPKPQNEEEDEYVEELTRQMANYMLQDDEKHQKSCSGGGGSGSPQSTLWSPFASGYSSPIGPSREPSPPLTPVTAMETQPVMIPFQSKQALIDDQIRSIQANFHKIKKEKDKQRTDDVLGHKARSYHQQQRPRSGVKAVFVDGSGSKTGAGGTGVFLPRSHGTVSCSGGGGSGSPQSTLWSPFASGYSSPIGPSREPSPPLTPVTAMETQPVMIPFQSKQALIDDQIRSIQANFHKIKKEKDKQRTDDVLGHKARSYHQQQRPRSGVKAVFVDGSGSKTGAGGTGVFLPRSHGTVVETRKKSGCSTVIIPARVVEALKVHFEKLGVPSTFSFDIPPFHDALLVSMKNKNNKSSSSTRGQSGPLYMAETSAETHQEPPADLPHEWTY